ncbi:MAG: signal peptidase I [Armatimonadetes bacterium]|nr:signal peptidase I [Armatimonadota bacterium]
MLPIFAQAQTSSSLSEIINNLARTPLSKVLIFVLICTFVRMAMHRYLASVAPHLRFGAYQILKRIDETADALVYAGVFVFFVIRPFVLQTFQIPSGSMVPTLLVKDMVIVNKAVYRYSDPKRGDIVVFRPPSWAVTPDQLDADNEVNVDFVKRCIGLPGDVVEVKNDDVYINGTKLDEPYKAFAEEIPNTNRELYRPLSEPEHQMHPKYDFKLVKLGGDYIPVYYSGDTFIDMLSVPKYQNPLPDVRDALMKAKPAPIPPGFYLMMGDNRYNSSDSRSWGLVPRESIVGRFQSVMFRSGVDRWFKVGY